ncbi:hypothetical protein ACFVYT_04775 [Streptomyces sp. NPDC058290]|uniref:hypothetical protein n=1 Tax=Streptomyces sp. NPDC058290 TaxID=3346426 RepID=UPI0036F0C3D5
MHRITRYTLPAALCVTLLSASPGLAGAANAPARPSAPVAKKSIPGTEALTAQVQALGSAGVLITPVTNFLGEVLKSPDGKLPEAALAAHKQKIDAALAGLKQTFAAVAPAAPAAPNAPEAPAKPPADAPAAPVVLPKPPAEVAKPPVEAAKPPAEVAKPPADAAKPPAEAAKPPAEAAKPPVEAAKPPAEVAKPPAEAAKPPVDAAKPVEAAKPPAAVAKPPAAVAKPPAAVAKPPVDMAKPPAEVAKPVTLPAAAPAPLPAVAPVSARAARAGAPLDLVAAAVDHLKASVDEVAKAAGPCGCTTNAKDKATDVVNDLGTTVVALFTGLGLPGMPEAAPAPAPDPAE